MDEDAARRHGGRPELELAPAGGGADLISALPEDLLLQVLVRLRCARAAARTGLLSRRWRGLWIRLPDLTFRDVALGSLLHVLASLEAAAGPGVFLLDIRVPAVPFSPGDKFDPAQLNERVSSLFDAASRISPVELRLALPDIEKVQVDLPRFHRATSIELQAPSLRLTLTRPPRASGGFPALKRLSLSDCRVDLADLVPHCPCLRVLSVSNAKLGSGNITIRSESLEELAVVNRYGWEDCIDIEAPMLKQLTMSFCTGIKLSVSIVAPILEKVSWGCFYTVVPVGLGPWGLWRLSLHAAESHGQRVLTGTGEDDTCLHLSKDYVLSLQIWACGLDWYPDAELKFAQEIEKHLVTDFSVLELHFMTMGPEYRIRSLGHVFGAFVVHLLGMHRIRTATRKLKVILQRSEIIKEECPVYCRCDEPKNWRSKNISLINLEEVEIKGFDGEDHEFDFWKVMFRCAPMLKRMAVRVSDEVRTSEDQCSRIHKIFQAYPFVECNVDLSSGKKVLHE